MVRKWPIMCLHISWKVVAPCRYVWGSKFLQTRWNEDKSEYKRSKNPFRSGSFRCYWVGRLTAGIKTGPGDWDVFSDDDRSEGWGMEINIYFSTFEELDKDRHKPSEEDLINPIDTVPRIEQTSPKVCALITLVSTKSHNFRALPIHIIAQTERLSSLQT